MLTGRLVKLVFVLAATAATYAAWQWRRHRAVKRLAEIDAGERCIACDGVAVEVQGGVAACRQCGQRTTLAAFQAVKVSAAEIENVTRPEE